MSDYVEEMRDEFQFPEVERLLYVRLLHNLNGRAAVTIALDQCPNIRKQFWSPEDVLEIESIEKSGYHFDVQFPHIYPEKTPIKIPRENMKELRCYLSLRTKLGIEAAGAKILAERMKKEERKEKTNCCHCQ